MPTPNFPAPDKTLAAVCGLLCAACHIYLATHDEDPRRIESLSKRYNLSVEEAKCHGCRSDKRFPYCHNCAMVACAAQKGLSFCGECDAFPCAIFFDFQGQGQRPHRLELQEWQAQIVREGWPAWFADTAARYTCPECGAINSTYDLACRHCGTQPSCAFVARHQETIAAYLKALS